ncbi:GyrI-like domain-containing protein [Corynebacterium mayonis]|uniref:GyrI-like domain-containing protein n=1 Tax=Corynebacterium mayonis TaxID=3062461 RepID=UPI00314047EC
MEKVSLPPQIVIGARDTLNFDEIGAFFDHYYPMMEKFLSSIGARPQAKRSFTLAEPTDVIDMIAAFLIAEEDLPMIEPLVGDVDDEKVALHRFAAGEFLKTRHTGPYVELSVSWEKFLDEARDAGYTPGPLSFEDYLDSDAGVDLYLSLELNSSSM